MRVGRIAVATLIVALLIGAFLFCASRRKDVVLFYHGAAAEVPRGRVIVVFNPLRNRDSENTAGRVIRDLRTEDCQPVVQSLSGGKDYDPRVCLVMGKTGNHNLIWRRRSRTEPSPRLRHSAEQPARLWITFRRHESGFEVSSISVVR